MERAVRVLIPVLDRPDRVGPLLESLRRSQHTTPLLPLFIVTLGDVREIAAIQEAEAPYVTLPGIRQLGDYARKINLGAKLEQECEWVFQGADDLCFCPMWAERAIAFGERHRLNVVGTNDLGNRRVMRGWHSTHSLVRTEYREVGTIDEPGKLMHEGYDHNYCDDEFVQTARVRHTFGSCRDSMVEHMHPHWRKGEDDLTYRRGMRRFSQDGEYFKQRQVLWTGVRMAHRPRRDRRRGARA